MKNTAPRVGAPRGAGVRAMRTPREAQGRKPRAGQGATLAPGRDKKCVADAGTRAGVQGWQTSGYRTEGKHPDTPARKTPRQPKKTPGGTPLCRAKREPRRGVPLGAPAAPGAGARQGQPANKAGKAHTTMRATVLRETAMVAKDTPKQGNKTAGRRNRQRPTERPSRRGTDDTTRAVASPHDRRSETSYRAGRRPPPARRRSRGDGRAQPSSTRRPRRVGLSYIHEIGVAE